MPPPRNIHYNLMQFPAIIMLYFCTNLEELYIMGVGRGGNRGITPQALEEGG